MPHTVFMAKPKASQTWRRNSSGRVSPNQKKVARATFAGGKKHKSDGKLSFKKPKKKWGKIIGLIILVGFIGGSLAIAGILAWAAKDLPDPNRIIERTVAESTKIYDRTGEVLLYDVHGDEKRTVVKLEEIPGYVVQATLAAEDRKFYEHKGVSITGILRSVIKNITTGSKVGGSTLTQQLVKNAVLTSEKTYTRKIKELILAWQIEQKFSKDEILQLYFNEIPYGSVAYGAEAAAQTYFGKSISDVTLAEAAILAALPQQPTRYSPYGNNVDLLIARQHWILDSMVELGSITEAEAEAAKNQELVFKERSQNLLAPHFVLSVREYLTETYGDLAVEQGGLQVITTLDYDKQQIAESVIAENAEKNAEQWNAHNAALLAIDAPSGQVLAMVGSKDFFADPYPENCRPGIDCLFDPQVNTTERLRQPGSSFKPIVYTAALKKGYTPETVVYDVETDFINYDATTYTPRNYDLKEHGAVTLRTALAGSLNIPAVKAIYLAGIDNVLDLADDLGYTTLTPRSRFGLSLVLGGGEIRLLEHVNAYATLAQEGEFNPATMILEVRDKDGNVLEEYKSEEKKVLETQVARQINNMLSDNNARAYVFGLTSPLQLGDRPVAAKTGTTNDYRDAWTIGFTPSLAAGVWVGNSDNTEMKRGAAGGVVAAPIWNAFMRQALADEPIESFTTPEPIKTDKPSLNGSIAEGITVTIDSRSGKLATNLTPPHLVEEKTFKEAHTILHYVNKDDPRGSTPPDFSDQQYQPWEDAVIAWAEEKEFVAEPAPTEFDDVHVPGNTPSITILAPATNQLITDRRITGSVSASAPRGIDRVEYSLNNNLIQVATEHPYDLNTTIGDIGVTSGFATLTATAFDDVDNTNQYSIELNLQLPEPTSSMTWKKPSSGQLLSQGNFPFTLEATLNNAAAIDTIDLYYRPEAGEQSFIATVRQFPSSSIFAQWSIAPAPGTYAIFGVIHETSGQQYLTPQTTITVVEPESPESE